MSHDKVRCSFCGNELKYKKGVSHIRAHLKRHGVVDSLGLPPLEIEHKSSDVQNLPSSLAPQSDGCEDNDQEICNYESTDFDDIMECEKQEQKYSIPTEEKSIKEGKYLSFHSFFS